MTTPLSSVPDRVLSPTRTAAAEVRRQRREQLRDFYGLPKGAPLPTSTPGTAPPGTPSGSGPTHSGSVPGTATSTASASVAGTPPASALASPELGGTAQFTSLATLAIPPSPSFGTASPALQQNGGSSAHAQERRQKNESHKDLSSPSFVPAEYYEDLIAKAGLAELLRTTSTLASDVGRLQSSRHTLVYNHHHQLFSAGDTIAQLNTRTPQLLSIVTSLQERFSDMSQLADSVALPEIDSQDARDGGALARAGAGVERVRLMVLADEPKDRIKETWERTESSLLDVTSTPQIEALLREGRQLAEAAA